MNFVADENVDGPIVYQLRHDGHDVIYIAEVEPAIDDDIILDQANKRNALLITTDKDFGELVVRQHLVHAGVILPQIEGFSPSRKASYISTPSVSTHVRS